MSIPDPPPAGASGRRHGSRKPTDGEARDGVLEQEETAGQHQEAEQHDVVADRPGRSHESPLVPPGGPRPRAGGAPRSGAVAQRVESGEHQQSRPAGQATAGQPSPLAGAAGSGAPVTAGQPSPSGEAARSGGLVTTRQPSPPGEAATPADGPTERPGQRADGAGERAGVTPTAALGSSLPPTAPPTAASTDASAAPADGPPADGRRGPSGGVRLTGLRAALATMTTRITADRVALAATEAAEHAGDRAVERLEHDRGEDKPSLFAPFRIGLLGGLGLLIAYTLYLSLDSIRDTLIVIAISAILAIGLDPAVRFLIRRGIRRGFAVLIVFLCLMGFLFGVFYAIIPPIVTEISAFISKLPDLLKSLQENPTIKSLDARFGIIKAIQGSDFVKNIGSGAPSVVFTAAGIVFDLIVVVILTLYFLAGLPRIKAAGYRLVPASRRNRVTDIGDKIIKQMGGYLGGSALIALQAGIVAGAFAWIAGLPYPWAIALAATVLDFVPVVGPVIIGVSMVLLGFSRSLTVGIIAGAFYICQHMFESYWLYPRVMRRTVHISSAAVIVAILVGGALLGIIGAVLAVPVAAAIQLIIREVLLPRQERS